jgi:hypothetical protein
MLHHSLTARISCCLLALLFALPACNRISQSNNAVVDSSKRVVYNARDKWKNLLTYQPEATPQLPQTRYCYKMQSDVVCYDSLQPSMTAKLVGYQDGENISWVQPGGGSLGYSGGPPTAALELEQASAPVPPSANKPIITHRSHEVITVDSPPPVAGTKQ